MKLLWKDYAKLYHTNRAALTSLLHTDFFYKKNKNIQKYLYEPFNLQITMYKVYIL